MKTEGDAMNMQDPVAVLHAGVQAAGGAVALACSFSVEDIVVLDMLAAQALPTRLFALDTGRLPEETYQTAEAVRARYGVAIEWHFPERVAVEALVRSQGLYAFRDGLAERHACCAVRKVEPLQRALSGMSGWITGQRREQSVTRAALQPLEREPDGRLKINPLWSWSLAQVWEYAQARGVPVHPLYHRGYTSIGCAPCTRATLPGEHPRAGRWWWEEAQHKECGLHRRGDGGTA